MPFRFSNIKICLQEVAAVGLVEIASVDIGGSRVPDGIGLAVVKVPGLNDPVDGFALADGVEWTKLEGFSFNDLRLRQAADGDVGTAVPSNRVLLIII